MFLEHTDPAFLIVLVIEHTTTSDKNIYFAWYGYGLKILIWDKK